MYDHDRCLQWEVIKLSMMKDILYIRRYRMMECYFTMGEYHEYAKSMIFLGQ
jgi:hypothetical protein